MASVKPLTAFEEKSLAEACLRKRESMEAKVSGGVTNRTFKFSTRISERVRWRGPCAISNSVTM